MAKILKLDHVGIILNDIDKTFNAIKNVLEIKESEEEVVKVDGDASKLKFFSIGDTHIELVEPIDKRGIVNTFLDNTGGGGIHHLAIEVDNIDEYYQQMKNKNCKMLWDDGIRDGSRGSKVFFFSPEEFNGLIIEVVER